MYVGETLKKLLRINFSNKTTLQIQTLAPPGFFTL